MTRPSRLARVRVRARARARARARVRVRYGRVFLARAPHSTTCHPIWRGRKPTCVAGSAERQLLSRLWRDGSETRWLTSSSVCLRIDPALMDCSPIYNAHDVILVVCVYADSRFLWTVTYE